MIKNIIKWAVKNRVVVLLLTVMLAVLGVYSYYIVPKQEAPDVTPPYALITVVYPGASAADVESLVTEPIEQGLKELADYKTMTSYSNDSLCMVLLELGYGSDTLNAFDELRAKMQQVQSELPEVCRDIEVDTDLVRTAGFMITLYSEEDSYNTDKLSGYAERIKSALSSMDGVARVDVLGVREQRLNIMVDIDELNATGVSMEDVVTLLAAQSAMMPVGMIEEKDGVSSVAMEGPVSKQNDIGNILVGVDPTTGKTIKLSDIATIYKDDADSNFYIEQDGHPSVLVAGYFKDDINVLLVGNEIRNEIDSVLGGFPEDVVSYDVLYQPDDVQASVDEFAGNLIQGVLLVILVVLVSMGLRNALIVSTAIPLSIVITFAMMPLFGVKIHQISIAALIVALGMLVDNAIVVSDSIQQKLDSGEKRSRACINGAREVAMPVLTSTLTTLAAFSPLLFLNSLAGDFVSSLPIIIIIALSASYVVAMVVTPAMASLFFKKRKPKKTGTALKNFFGRMLDGAIKKPALLWTVVALLVAVAGYITTLVPLQLFPETDDNIVYIDVKAYDVQHVSQTGDIIHQIQEYLDTRAEVATYTSAIGNGLPRFHSTMGVPIQKVDAAQIMMRVDYDKYAYDDDAAFVESLQNGIDALGLNADAKVKLLEYAVPSEAAVEVNLSHGDYKELTSYINIVKEEMQDIDGTVDIRDNYNQPVRRYVLDIDADSAAKAGIAAYTIKNEASIALMGRTAAAVNMDGKLYDVFVNSDAGSIEDLQGLEIVSPTAGVKVAISTLSSLSEENALPSIVKVDGLFSVRVSCDVERGVSAVKVSNELEEALDNRDFGEVEYTITGERDDIAKNFGDMGILAAFALVLVFLIIFMQFKNFRLPFIILVSIPLSAVGAMAGIYLTGQPLSFVALMGIVALLGIVVNNAIVLVDCANNLIKGGMNPADAAVNAAQQRFRPIMLTAVTTIIGMLPLIYGSVLFRPLAVAIISGLLLSTLLTLVVIPSAIAHSHYFTKRKILGGKDTAGKGVGGKNRKQK